VSKSILNIATPTQLADDGTLDVTPIMNMFIILIPFLVSMAVFSHLSVLQFSLPPDGGTDRIQDEIELPLTIAMTIDEIAITRGEAILLTIPHTDGRYDYESLAVALQTLRTDDNQNNNIVLAVDDNVVFENIVECMDRCRESGFEEIGLAAGTGLDRTIATGESDAVD